MFFISSLFESILQIYISNVLIIYILLVTMRLSFMNCLYKIIYINIIVNIIIFSIYS